MPLVTSSFPSFECSLMALFVVTQEVAVKRMTATKTKEFAAEMKVLCKVHHSNLVSPRCVCV